MIPPEFDSFLRNLKKLPGELKLLVEKRIELFTLELGERVAGLIAYAMYRLTGIAFLALGMILVLFAASNFAGEMLDSEGLGYIVVASPLLLLGLMFFFRRPRFMVIATRDKLLYQFMKDLGEQMGQSDTANKQDSTTQDQDSTTQDNDKKNSPDGSSTNQNKTKNQDGRESN